MKTGLGFPMKSVRQVDLVGTAVLCVLVLGSVLGPIRAKITERNQIIARRQSALIGLAEQENIEKRLQETQEEFETHEDRIAELHRSFPSQRELDSFLSELNQMARLADTELLRVVPGAFREGDVFSRVAVQVEAHASFENFYRFLLGLDQMGRLSQVEKLSVSVTPSSGVCSIQMTLCIFISTEGAQRDLRRAT